MAAVPIYVWNGSAWQETGPTIPANPIKYQASAPSSPSTGDIWVDSDGDVTTGSQQFQRFRFVASGGETTISGADANGAVLAYTAGLEQVVLNGAVLVRGHDYTATTGTTITGLSPALVASDVLEVFSFIAFTVANTYTQSQVDGLVAAAPGLKLLVPGSATNGTVGATGTVTFSGAGSISINDVFSATYRNYRIVASMTCSSDTDLSFRLRVGGADLSSANSYYYGAYYVGLSSSQAFASINQSNPSNVFVGAIGGWNGLLTLDVSAPFIAAKTAVSGQSSMRYLLNVAGITNNIETSYTGFSLIPSAGSITGQISVYGYKD